LTSELSSLNSEYLSSSAKDFTLLVECILLVKKDSTPSDSTAERHEDNFLKAFLSTFAISVSFLLSLNYFLIMAPYVGGSSKVASRVELSSKDKLNVSIKID
jgi:hypothetical protein